MKSGAYRMRSPVRGSRGSRRRAVTIAVACGLVIVLVAAAVFSIGSRSRLVVRHASDLHALNESLRSVTVVRSQVGFSAFLASVDARFGTDSRDVIAAAVLDARRSLGDTRATVDATGRGSPLDEPALRDDVQAFADEAERVLRLVVDGRSADARTATARLDAAFERARSEIIERRDAKLAELVDDDERLWRLGILASFVVAFVVPAGIVFLYIGLTRRPRREVEAELDGVRRRRLRERQAVAADAALEALRDGIRRGDGGAALATLDDLTVLMQITDGGSRQEFTGVAMADVLRDVAAAARGPSGPPAVRCDDETAWTDPGALRHLLRNLVNEATGRGGRDVQLLCTRTAGHVQVAVTYRGRPIPEDAAEAITTGAWEGTSPPPPNLAAVIALAEGLGARLGVLSEPSPALLVQLDEAPVATPSPTAPARAPHAARNA